MIYDIIPVRFPQFCDDINRSAFLDYLPEVLRLCDGIICISRYTMTEALGYCNRMGINREISSDYFHLGADFVTLQTGAEVDAKLTNDLGDDGLFLMVGTIEPRKNHVFVVEAFERLWERGSTLKLCIVGKVGWKCHAIIKKITENRFFNRFLFFNTDLNDNDLAYCFSKSSAVIIASIVEGFGLPLIEAMHFGKVVLASDIPVFREIGGEYPYYFLLGDTDALIDGIVLASEGKLSRQGAVKSWLSWDESIAILMGKVVSMAQKAHQPS
jgi:alpha-1,2-rhamnosyltransferase